MDTIEHTLTKQENTKLMKVMNEFSFCSDKNGMNYKIIQLNIVRVAGVALLRMKTKSINKGFTTSRTGDRTFYPVLHWSITLSDDRGFAFTLDQSIETQYVVFDGPDDDGEILDNWM
jgi:hypothetical protein